MQTSRVVGADTVRIDWLPRREHLFDHSIDDVWPFIDGTDGRRWIKPSDPADDEPAEPAKPYVLGELIRGPRFDEQGNFLGSMIVEVVRLVRKRTLVLKIVTVDAPPLLGFIDAIRGYEVFNVFDLGGSRTLLNFQTVAEFESSVVGQEELEARVQEYEKLGKVNWGYYFKRLEKFLAAQSPAPAAD